MQDANNRELQHSNAKVVDARSRSPAKNNRSSYGGSAFKPRGNGSPLRSSYKATYNY